VTTRPLTSGEIGAAREVFGKALDYAPVRLWAQPFGFGRVFVAGRWFGRDWIVWPKAELKPDYARPGANFGDLATLIHELVHVWQAQQGVNLALAKLKAGDRPDSYAYSIGDDTHWKDLNIEQQARAVEDEFRRRRHGQVVTLAGAGEAYRRISPFEQSRTGSP
jgi:hypothetical protein